MCGFWLSTADEGFSSPKQMEKRTVLEKSEIWFQVGFWGGNEKYWWDESLILVHENTLYKMLLAYF